MHHGNINHFTFLIIIILQSVALDNQICHKIVDDSLTTNHQSICSVMFLTRIFSNNMKLSNCYFLTSVSRMSRMVNFRHDCDVTTILFSDFPYKSLSYLLIQREIYKVLNYKSRKLKRCSLHSLKTYLCPIMKSKNDNSRITEQK